VLEVIDGDTIRVSLDGHEEKVRYLAVDCPEIAHDDQPGERLGDEATSANARLVQGQTVWLVADAPDRDPYDRLLRWVWADGVLMNAELVRQGLAYLRDNADGSRYAALLHAAEREAQQAGRGLWAATPTSAPRPKPTVTATPAATPSPGPCSYVGNASSLIFHHASCDSVAKMAEGNKVCFASRDEAIGQGYRPCKRCNP
jgi:micrococcal nuclease